MSDNIVNITIENIQQELLEASKHKLVLIDFWADWCEPCKQLMPVLEKLAFEFADNLVLAKINCDEQQQIAMQFGVKSLPTVVVFKDGQPIDGFAGVQSESEIRSLLDKYLPKIQDEWFANAQVLMAEGNWQEAYPLVRQAFEAEQERIAFLFAFANVSIELGKIEDAENLLATVTMVNQDSEYQQLIAKLDLAKQAADSPEVKHLQEALNADPENNELKQKLAIALNQANRNEEALELLFSILRKDMVFGDAKKYYLDIIANLAAGDELSSRYRRKLYTLMY